MRGRGRKTDPTTCTRGQATAASAIDSASRIFRWREAAIIHERCHYARKPYAIASAATPRNRLHSPLAEIKGVCSSIIILLESSSLGKTSLEPCPMKKKARRSTDHLAYISRFIFSTTITLWMIKFIREELNVSCGEKLLILNESIES